MANIFTTLYDSFMSLDYLLIILILAIVITILTTIIYKYTTDQKRLKEIKKQLKELRDKQKKYKDNPKKINELTKQMLEMNSEMMKQSFKSMIYTFIPLILLFSWMTASLSYQPIMPEQEFYVTALISPNYSGNISEIKLSSVPAMMGQKNESYSVSSNKGTEIQWALSAPQEGTYTILIEGDTFKQTKEILITSNKKYLAPVSEYKDSQLLKISVGYASVRPLGEISLLGWKPGWLGVYIILSIIINIIVRKILDIA